MANMFAGSDRRALEQLVEAIKFIRRRDRAAEDPKPSASISTRQVVNDRNQPAIWEAFRLVEIRADDCLDASRGATLPAIPIPPGKRIVLLAGAVQLISTLKATATKPETTVAVVTIDEQGVTYRIGSTAPAVGGATVDLRYLWLEFDTPSQTFPAKAAFELEAEEYAKYFV